MNKKKKLQILVVTVALGLCSAVAQAQQTVTEAWGFSSDPGTQVVNSIALDGFGNVFQTGSVQGTSSDWKTQMLSPTGMQRWATTYNSPTNRRDRAYSLALDARGNSYVTGFGDTTCQTIKYDADGNQIWKAFPSDFCASSAIDAAGNIIIIGTVMDGTGYIRTIKYSPDGTALWTRVFAGSAMIYGTKVALDANGNIFVAGSVYREDMSLADYTVVKYDSAGNQLWMKQLDVPAAWPRPDRPLIAVDAAGNVVVASTFTIYDESGSTALRSNIVVAKIDTNGSLAWQTIWYHAVGYFYDSIVDVAVDAAGDVIVTGNIDGASPYSGIGAVVKFAGYTGTYQWVNTFGGVIKPNYDLGQGHSLVTDGEGNSYMAGKVGSDGKIFKFNSAGTQIWSSAAYPGATFYALALDGKGCLVAAGGDSAGRLTVKLCQQGALVCN